MLDAELAAFCDPAAYSVPEGENQMLVLRANKTFAVPFTIDVTLMDITAVGKCLLSFPCTMLVQFKSLLRNGSEISTSW